MNAKFFLISLSSFLWGVFPGQLAAQTVAPDTVSQETPVMMVDSTREAPKTGFFNFKADYPNPKKAAILSLAFPGAGQFYNKRYWKLPLVYGALGGMAYTINFNQDLYRRMRDALNLKRQNLEHEFSNTGLDNESTLRTLRDTYDKRTQLSYIGFVIVYALQAMEAFVDAHLKGFDVEDDLGFRVEPQINWGPLPDAGPTLGLGVTIPFGGARTAVPPRP